MNRNYPVWRIGRKEAWKGMKRVPVTCETIENHLKGLYSESQNEGKRRACNTHTNSWNPKMRRKSLKNSPRKTIHRVGQKYSCEYEKHRIYSCIFIYYCYFPYEQLYTYLCPTLHYILGNTKSICDVSSEAIEAKRKWNIFTKIPITHSSVTGKTTLPKQRQEKAISDQSK